MLLWLHLVRLKLIVSLNIFYLINSFTCVKTRAYILIYYRVYKLGFRKKSCRLIQICFPKLIVNLRAQARERLGRIILPNLAYFSLFSTEREGECIEHIACIYSGIQNSNLNFPLIFKATAADNKFCDFFSGLDKDLDQWVFHPLLFNLMSILLHT